MKEATLGFWLPTKVTEEEFLSKVLNVTKHVANLCRSAELEENGMCPIPNSCWVKIEVDISRSAPRRKEADDD